MNGKFKYEVVTRASSKLAWEVFSNWRRWHSFSNIYGSLTWKQGTPWSVGSRLLIEIVQPVHAFIDHVITFCEPEKRVGWIDNAFGVAIEQWVSFETLPSKDTRVTLVGEIVGGESLQISERSSLEHVIQFTKTWYDNFKIVCDELAPRAA